MGAPGRWRGVNAEDRRATRRELLDRYAERTGRDVSNIEYYRALSAFRLAVISEGVYARYLHGVMADDGADVEMFKTNVEDLAERALQALSPV